jgi:hypothetical protein
MRKELVLMRVLLLCGAVAGSPPPARAQEHPTEHPKQTAERKAPLTTEQLAKAIATYVASDAQTKGGYFLVWDPVEKRPLALTLDRVHEDRLSSLGGGVYFACADFKSTEGKAYDIDVFMKDDKGALTATEVHVHKVEGKPRYTWKEEGGVWLREEIK